MTYEKRITYEDSGVYKILFSNASGASDIIYTYTLSTSTWYLLTASHSGTTNKLYINGALVNTNTSAGTNDQPTGRLVIGGRWEGASINYVASSKLDEVIIESRAWSDSEVKKYYALVKGRYL